MFAMVQTHHGISCSDIVQTKKILRLLGFTDFQPGAPEPLIYTNTPDNPIGQVTAPVLGDEYHTHYVENPNTGQQIDLIEIRAEALTPRPCVEPAQGDLVIGFPVDDPMEMYRAMRAADPDVVYSDPVDVPEENGIRFIWRDGQHSILTRNAEPFAILHYATADFPKARQFYEEILDVPIEPLPGRDDGVERYRMGGIKGRMDIEVRPTTKRLDLRAWGKHYPSANHFRLIERDVPRIERKIKETGLGGFVIAPMGGFVFVHGPTSETIEMFDRSFQPGAMAEETQAAE